MADRVGRPVRQRGGLHERGDELGAGLQRQPFRQGQGGILRRRYAALDRHDEVGPPRNGVGMHSLRGNPPRGIEIARGGISIGGVPAQRGLCGVDDAAGNFPQAERESDMMRRNLSSCRKAADSGPLAGPNA